MQLDEQRKLHIECGLFFAIVFAVMFTLSLMTPLIADDFNYTFGYSNGRRISSLRDVWISMIWHRRMLNGRVFSHGWLSIVLMFDRWVFAALNATVAVFFSWTTIGFFRARNSKHPLCAAAAVWMLLWVCMPGFGQVFFWTAGACNYFWSIAFSWFIIWRVLCLEKDSTNALRRTLLLLIPAFVSGAWSEHISFAMLLILFFLLLRSWIHTRQFPLAEVAVLLSGCGGYLFLMLAPASKLFQRLHDAGDPTEEGNLTRILSALPNKLLLMVLVGVILMILATLVLWRLRGACFTGCVISLVIGIFCCMGAIFFSLHDLRADGIYGLISSAQVGFFSLLGAFCISLCVALRSQVEHNQVQLALILAMSGICGFALFLFGEYLPLRGFCAPVTLLALATIGLADSVFEAEISSSSGIPLRMKAALIGLTLCFTICFSLGVQDILLVHREAQKRETDFAAAAAGDKRVTVTPYIYHTKYTAQYGNPDLAPDADWPNGDIANYYDVVRIIVVEDVNPDTP